METYELQKLRDLPIEGVAERLGLRPDEHHKCLCPFHDDHHASLSFSRRRNTCRCFACMDRSMGTIDLVMRVLGKDFMEACRWLASDACISLSAREPAQQEQTALDVSRYERYFMHPRWTAEAQTFLFAERHLDERVMRWCRVTSYRDRRGVSWLQIPYYDAEGRLMGVQMRNLTKGALPRFRFPQGSQCRIYNLPIVKRLRQGDDLWISEGCSDCWAMLSSGHKAIAIPSATLLSAQDSSQLQALSSELGLHWHMYPDQDAPGERLYMQLRQILPTLTHHQLPPGCKDYSELFVQRHSSSVSLQTHEL